MKGEGVGGWRHKRIAGSTEMPALVNTTLLLPDVQHPLCALRVPVRPLSQVRPS